MPSPVAHSAAGIALYLLIYNNNTNFRKSGLKPPLLLALAVFLANLPDFDFIPGFLIGDPNRFHHGISHSLIFALSIASLVYLMVKKTMAVLDVKKLYLLLVLTLSSHVVLDFLTWDGSEPFGVPMFWPFSSDYVISPHSFFMGVTRSGESNLVFLASLFNKHNLMSLLGEVFFSLGILASAVLVNNYSVQHNKLLLVIAAPVSLVIFLLLSTLI